MRPILIYTVDTTQSPYPTGLEIVPWKPCFPAQLLQLWTVTLHAIQMRKSSHKAAFQSHTNVVSVHIPEPESDHRMPSEDAVNNAPSSGKVPKKKRGGTGKVTIPTELSHPAIPVSEGSVRRFSQHNKIDGFFPVHLEKEPTKKRKIGVVQINENTGKTVPISLDLLQSWGIDYGVAPRELTLDKLLQTPSATKSLVYDADQDNDTN